MFKAGFDENRLFRRSVSFNAEVLESAFSLGEVQTAVFLLKQKKFSADLPLIFKQKKSIYA